MTEPLGTFSANAVPTATCPFCGRASSTHEANACLDRWVHEQFLGRTVSADGSVPRYSATQDGAIDSVINAGRWPQGAALMQTSHGCTVGLMVQRSGEYEHYEVLAAAPTLPLAVCRAAVCGLAGGGDSAPVIR